jgi:hypothetical protein
MNINLGDYVDVNQTCRECLKRFFYIFFFYKVVDEREVWLKTKDPWDGGSS